MRLSDPIGHVVGRWLRGEGRTEGADTSDARNKHKDRDKDKADPNSGHAHAAPWYATLWLTGVDYFSSLGYAPGISFLAAPGTDIISLLEAFVNAQDNGMMGG